MGLNSSLMEIYIKANFSIKNFMVLEHIILQMVWYLKDILRMDNNKVQENIITNQVILQKLNWKALKSMESKSTLKRAVK